MCGLCTLSVADEERSGHSHITSCCSTRQAKRKPLSPFTLLLLPFSPVTESLREITASKVKGSRLHSPALDCFNFMHAPHALTPVRTHARTRAHTHTHARTYTHTNTRSRARTYTHARTHARARAHTHTRTHARTHARACTRTLQHLSLIHI